MSFLPPVVMEMRANASQFLSEQGKVIASAKTTALETEKAAQKEAAAARTSAAEATRAAEQKTAAAETSAKAAQVATDKRIVAEGKATEAQAKAAQMQAALTDKSTAEQQAAYDKQVAAADRAANAVSLAAAKEAEAQGKATAATKAASDAQKAASDAQVVAAEKTAAAQELAATRTKTAMSSVVGVANKVSAASILAAGAVAVGSLEMASKFEKSTMLLVTAGGEQMSALSGVRKGILDISTQTGTSAEMMSEGMYIMEKAGYRGAAGLAALKAAAQGAKDENVDLATMSQAVTDVLLDYGYKMDTAANATDSSVRVTNMLVAASGAAKTTMTDFAGSMSAVIPIASTAKISFDQIGGAIATMTQHGQTAQQSSQNLANLIQSLVRPNNLASAAMSQLGIDTTDLAEHLSERGLSGSLKVVSDAIMQHMGPDGMVLQKTMKDNANATMAMQKIIAQMPPDLANLSHGLLDGSVSQKEFGKTARETGGSAGALGNQLLGLYKANSGVNDQLKAGKPAIETYNAAMRDVFGNVTAARAATMLLMNDSHEFEANIKAIGEAGKKTGQDISTWADMQSTLSVKMDQTKNMVTNLGIELGTKLMPAAKDAIAGFTDLVHGFEQGNPVLLGVAGIIGGALTISAVNFGIQMGRTVVKTVSGLVDMGATAIAQSSLFVKGMLTSEIAVGQFSTKAEIAGSKVKGMSGMLTGAAAGLTAVAAAAAVMAANTDHATVDADKMTKALTDFADAGNAAGKTELNTMFSTWDTMFGKSTSDVKGLDDALQHVLHPSGLAQAYSITDGLASSIGLAKTALGQAQDKVKAMGVELGNLAGTNITKAQAAFQHLALGTDGSKESLTKLLDSMPAYKQALQGQVDATGKVISSQELVEFAYGKIPKVMLDAMDATKKYTDSTGLVRPITPELQKSLEAAGVSAEGLATDLQKVLSGMLDTGLATMSARDATARFNKTTADAKKAMEDLVKSNVPLADALNQAGTDFDLTTEAGQQLNSKLEDVARTGIDMAKSVKGNDIPAQKEMQADLQRTYDNLLKSAEGMGIHGQAAVDLTRKLLGIPPNVDVKTWMDDTAKQKADALEGVIQSLDGHVVHTFIDVQTNADGAIADYNNAVQKAKAAGHELAYANGGLVAFADGGMVGGYPGGGLLSGPGTGTSDSMLARVSNGEFIVRQAAVQKYGVGFLSQLNKGSLAPAAGYAGATGSASPAGIGQSHSSAPNVTIYAQTNATASNIANELSWALRTL